ncbi:B-lymphocyte antigen CD20 [Symphorus nematophorus]
MRPVISLLNSFDKAGNFRSESRRMKKTFVCDDSMIVTIPIGSLTDVREGQLMPEKFQCVYKDSFKVFVINGKPKPLGAAQAITGVFIVTLGLIFSHIDHSPDKILIKIYTLPSVVYVVSGMLSFAAGQSPNMHVTKLSFSLNIIGFFWSIAAVSFCVLHLRDLSFRWHNVKFHEAVSGLIMSLLVTEKLMALFLIYWLSKAVCRQHFNTLPIILLKQGD